MIDTDMVSQKTWDLKKSSAKTVLTTAENAKTVCWKTVQIVLTTGKKANQNETE